MQNRKNTNNSIGSTGRAEASSIHKDNVYSELTSDEPEVVEPSEVLFISSYPPRECGIATYSQDLIKALNNKFGKSFDIKVCALESGEMGYSYGKEVKYILNTSVESQFGQLACTINQDDLVKVVMVQHVFGLFRDQEEAFKSFLVKLSKPVVIAFHTVLPIPNSGLKEKVQSMVSACTSVIVMTHKSAQVLAEDYDIAREKITVIPHGTHLVAHIDKDWLKEKHGLKNRKVISTFGLLSSGKGIETTLESLPVVIKANPEVVFLIIGRTHPGVVSSEGEIYREKLMLKVKEYQLENHVIFINSYLGLPELLEYLQLTDIYLFTSIDPNQAVSGTFAYAMSCACPIISTPIPHAKEVLTKDTGIIFDFGNSQQLAEAIILLLNDEALRKHFSLNTLQNIVSTVWENSSVAHSLLFERISNNDLSLEYSLPEINFDHLKRLTTEFGMIQFSKINQPDINSGYTLDDNARALIAFCQHYTLTGEENDLFYIDKFLNFIKYCQKADGEFLNYVDKRKRFTIQNYTVNLDDSNGRALWALGYLTTLEGLLPSEVISRADSLINKALPHIEAIHSPRAMAFAIKGLYHKHISTSAIPRSGIKLLITLAKRLVKMYKIESAGEWQWYESYLTYANSVIPEAMLYAWMLTESAIYRDIARTSFDFLLSQTFNENGIEVISNKHWHKRGEKAGRFGEQPIDVAYTIITLGKFYDAFGHEAYYEKMKIAFNWYLGKNRLHQIIYNPCTGGCYDGLEEKNVNLNQGAESSLSYLMARQTIEGYITSSRLPKGIFPMQTDNPARAGSKEDEAFAHQEIKYPWINHSLLGGNYGRGRL
jgi:glycosyltransferase involved in cell wall biosynthesis